MFSSSNSSVTYFVYAYFTKYIGILHDVCILRILFAKERKGEQTSENLQFFFTIALIWAERCWKWSTEVLMKEFVQVSVETLNSNT